STLHLLRMIRGAALSATPAPAQRLPPTRCRAHTRTTPASPGPRAVTFLAGTLYLPSLGPSRVEMILALLLLAAVALLCAAVGQLAVIIERLERREDASAPHEALPT